MIFVKERRSKISKANPNMPVLQIMKEVGSQWQNLDPADKQNYQKLADVDKIRYKEQLKEFEKEVEKLQVGKPGKGKGSSKSKKKPDLKIEELPEERIPVKEKSDYKRRCVESDQTDSSLNLTQSKNIKKEEVTKNEEEDFSEYFRKEYIAIFTQNYINNTLDIKKKAELKWNTLSVENKKVYQRNPKLIKSLVMSDIMKLREEAQSKARIPPRNISRNDQFIKRPMNVNKQESVILAPKVSNPVIYKPKPTMGYQMRTEPTTMQPPMSESEGVTLSNSTT